MKLTRKREPKAAESIWGITVKDVHTVENLTDKPITEFVPGDTIYLTKMVRGYRHTYLCKFVEYSRGCVTGDVIDYEPNWAHTENELKQGIRVRVRLKNCHLWGVQHGSKITWPYCHRFDPKTKRVRRV